MIIVLFWIRYRWWEDENRDESIKWNTLQHHGVCFPPEYVPHGIKMKYDGMCSCCSY